MVFANANEYNALIASLSAACLKLAGNSKSTAAAGAEAWCHGMRDKIVANPAEAIAIVTMSAHRNAPDSRPDKASIQIVQWAWLAFLEDLKAKILL